MYPATACPAADLGLHRCAARCVASVIACTARYARQAAVLPLALTCACAHWHAGSDAQLHSQLRSNPAATHCLPICALHSACRVMAFYVPFRDIVAAALHMHFDHETHPRCFGQAERLRQQLGCLLFPYMPPGNALAARSHGSAQGAQGTAALSAGSAVGTMVAGGDPCGVVAVTAADAAVAASAARGAASTTEQAAAATDLNALLADLPVELLDEPSAAQPPDMRCTEPGCCAPASSCSADIGAMTFDPAATLCVRAVPAPSVRPVAPPAAVALVSSEQDFDPLQAHVVLRSLQSAPVTAEPPPALALQRQASRMDGDADTPAPPPAPPRALRRFGSRLEASALSPAPADDCSPAALPDSGARQRAGREAARVPIPALPPALVRAHPLGLQRRDESTEASTDFVPAGLHITSASTATPLVALQSLAPLTVADAGDQYVAGVQGSLGAYSPRQLVPIAGYGQPACSESAAAGIRTVPGTVVDFYNVVFLPAASGIVSELRRVWQ